MTTELTVSNREVGIMIPPEETIEIASRAAKALKRVVSLKPKPIIMNGEQYLEFDDLQLLGQFYGYTVRTGDALPVEVDGVKGAKAHADLIDFKTGMYLGGAEAYCMRDEEHWNTRPKYEWQGEGDNRKRVKVGDEVVPWFQLASMAQTRAGAKAFRNRLAWVVVLAGYRPTPAEEMTDSTVSEAVKERRTVDKSEHYCEVHGVNFFKKGRMKGHAHPIEDENGKSTGEWCNEPEPKESIIEQQEEAPLPATGAEKAEPKPAKKKTAGLTWDSLRPSLTELYNAKFQGWAVVDSIIEKLVELGATETDKIQVAFESLSDEAKVKFSDMVKEAAGKLPE